MKQTYAPGELTLHYGRAGWGVLQIVLPVWFVWMLELAVQTSEIRDTTYTFVVWSADPILTYHLLMYMLFIVSWVTGIWIITSAVQIRNTKDE